MISWKIWKMFEVRIAGSGTIDFPFQNFRQVFHRFGLFCWYFVPLHWALNHASRRNTFNRFFSRSIRWTFFLCFPSHIKSLSSPFTTSFRFVDRTWLASRQLDSIKAEFYRCHLKTLFSLENCSQNHRLTWAWRNDINKVKVSRSNSLI